MKRSLIWLALCATACNSATTTAPPTAQQSPTPQPLAASQPPSQRAAPAKPQAAIPVMATIPAGAKYSIYCDAYSGPDHFAASNAMKELLLKNSQLRDWYVVHQSDQSTLYEGYYKEINPQQAGLDKATQLDAQRARREKALVESIPDPRSPQRKLFPRTQFYLLDSPDPDAPAAWSLTNAPGYWSVQVAAFTGYDRKQKTIEAVRAARTMTPPVEAYYYHGGPQDTVSIVCVGSWPAEAIKRQDQANASGRDALQKVIVDTGETPLTPAQIARMTNNDPNVRVLQAKADILDPTLKRTLDDYPEHAVDGAVQMVQAQDDHGKLVMVPRPSMIVPIPHNVPTPVGGNVAGADDASPSLLDPTGGAQQSDLRSRLKGIGQ